MKRILFLLIFLLISSGFVAFGQVESEETTEEDASELKDKAYPDNKQVEGKEEDEEALEGKPEQVEQPEKEIEQPKELAKPKKDIWGFDLFQTGKFPLYKQVSNQITVSEDYVVNTGDILTVNFWNNVDFKSTYFEVTGSGYIEQDDWGRVYVAGLTMRKVRELLKRKYLQLYPFKDDDFEVVLSSAKNISVEVVGEVESPGFYTISAINSPFNVLSLVGGPKLTGSVRSIQVQRAGQTIYRLDVYKYLTNSLPNETMYLQEGDVIYVPKIGKVVELEGQVKNKTKYELLPNERFKDLMKYSGGFNSDAYKNKIQIFRYEDAKYVVRDFNVNPNSTQSNDPELRDGDLVLVKKIDSKVENVLSIEGAVNDPGVYEFREGIKVAEVIRRAEGLRFDALNSKAYITRMGKDLEEVNLSFDLNEAITNEQSKENLLLYPKDKIIILSKTEFKSDYAVEIFGAVKKPGKVVFGTDMTLQDLLVFSGGFETSALNSKIELHRIVDYDETEGRVVPIRNLVESIDVDFNFLNPEFEGAKIKLRPFDQIFVRSFPDFGQPEIVTIAGEVNFPGEYPLTNRNMRVSDLIEVSGGLNSFAYVTGAKFYRNMDITRDRKIVAPSTVEERVQEKALDTTMVEQNVEKEFDLNELYSKATSLDAKDSIATSNESEMSSYVVVINLSEILRNKNSAYNYVLQPGDKLFIPTVDEVVTIQGAINNEFNDQQIVNTAFVGKKSAKWYINNYAAGYDKGAAKSSTVVIYPNGQSIGTRRFLFSNIYPIVQPGSEILVQYKPPKQPKSESFWGDFTAEKAVAMIGSIVSATALIIVAVNNSN